MSRSKTGKRILIVVAVVVVIGGLIAANLIIKKKPKGTKVDVTEAVIDSLTQTVTASGKIQPKVDVNISAEVSGRILYIGAKEGDTVKKGDLLVQIEDVNYKAALKQMEYSLTSAEASLEEARSRLKRVLELHQSSIGNLASDADLEAQEAAVKRLEADVDRMKANITQAEDNLAKTRIYSPIDGVITRMNKEVGEMAIGASFTEDVIMVVSQLDQMEVNVEINENDVVQLSLGDPVSIEIFAMPDTTLRGKVTEIAHSGIIRGQGTAEEVTNFEVKVSVLDNIAELRPGMSATVEIVTDHRDSTLVLPQEAIAVRNLKAEKLEEERARKGGKAKRRKGKRNSFDQRKSGDEKEKMVEVVYIVENDTAWVRPVKLGIYSDTKFEILSGIEPGELVITGPFRVLARDLHSGQRVEYTPPQKDEDQEDPPAGENGESASETEKPE